MELDSVVSFLEGLDAIWYLCTFLLVVWAIIWKGVALWQAGKNDHFGWFIAIFLVQTFGILEIIFLLSFNRVVARPQKDKRKW